MGVIGKRRKGQFFILGALALVILFSANLSMTNPIISGPERYVSYFSGNIQKELPRAMNLGMNQSAPGAVMLNFSRFVQEEMSSRRINYSSLWLVAEGNESTTDVNVTVGNFMWGSRTVTITLDGTQKSVYVPDNSSNTTGYSSVPAIYNITISYGSTSRTYEWQRSKTSLYAYISLEKGEDSSKEHISA